MSQSINPDSHMNVTTKALLEESATRAIRYLTHLDERSVFPEQAAIDALAELDTPLPAEPLAADDVLRMLDEIGSPATVASNGGRYFGFVVGSALPVTQAASWLATAWDQNSGINVLSPVAARLEEITAGWLVDLFGLPAGTATGFVSGATMANFSGLAAARHTLLARQGWDVEAQGLFGAPPITVVVGDEVHVSLLKALSLLGLGRERVVRVPVDGQGRMRAGALPKLDSQTIVCVQVGNVNTGACDPLPAICGQAQTVDAWVHVDGAFGMWAAAAPRRAYLTTGLAQADSWATDAHKWLNVPYDSGLVFCRHATALAAAMSTQAAYLIQDAAREPYHYTPEMSQRARGIEVWAALRSLGRTGLATLIDDCCQHAQHLATALQEAGCRILNDVVLNQVLVAFPGADAAATDRIIRAIQEDGTCWCGGTTWQGHRAMRISVSSWATTGEDVKRSVDAIVRVACATTGETN